jgi:hypothetical protein
MNASGLETGLDRVELVLDRELGGEASFVRILKELQGTVA